MSPQPAPEAVVLDLDGTLIDHRTAAREALQATFADWYPGLDLDPHKLEETWSRGLDRHLPRYLSGELTFPQTRRARMRDFAAEFGLSDLNDDARADAVFGDYSRRYARNWKPFPDAGPAIAALRAAGFALAVFSNGDRRQQEAKLAVLKLSDPLPLYLPADVGAAKPDPRAFQGVCTALGVPPSRCVYVGDELEKDAVGAHRAGLTGVWLHRDHQPTPSGAPTPDHVITSLAQLPALLTP